MKSNLTKQEKEHLDNKIVFVSSAIFLYAMLLAFVQQMSLSVHTVNGALAFIKLLKYVALVGAMGCAAWSAYREKKSFFVYCVMCIFIFFSTTVIQVSTARISPYVINYVLLAAMFVLTQVFYAIKIRSGFEKKGVKIAFIIACAAILVAFAVVVVININQVFLPEFMVNVQNKIFGLL